jgi:hypothetical protein
MATVDDVRAITAPLPRSYEVLVRDRVKFRVGRLVYAALSRDETLLGFGYPREERAALVEADPVRFLMPEPSDERYQWVRARLAELDRPLLAELLVDAWMMVVPKRVAAEYQAAIGAAEA